MRKGWWEGGGGKKESRKMHIASQLPGGKKSAPTDTAIIPYMNTFHAFHLKLNEWRGKVGILAPTRWGGTVLLHTSFLKRALWNVAG